MIGKRKKSRLRYFPQIIILVSSVTILSGLAGTLLPSFGYMPVIGSKTFSIQPWIDFLTHPGIFKSIRTTLISGWSASLIALFLSIFIVSLSYENRAWRLFEKFLAPILSIPHAGFAIGFAFLISPSGWILRALSPQITGFVNPPDWTIVKDSYGISLMSCMVFKETPFLLLMIMGALTRIDVKNTLALGKSLGYHRSQVWFKLIVPQFFSDIRLPFYAVLAYSLSVVDLSIILGPTSPPGLSVIVFQWFNDADINMRLMGAAGACGLLLIVILSILIMFLFEKAVTLYLLKKAVDGKRQSILSRFTILSNFSLYLVFSVMVLSVTTLVIWSFTWQWSFPSVFPESWSFLFWQKSLIKVKEPVLQTLWTAFASTITAIVLTIGCLEYELTISKEKFKKNFEKSIWFLYLPLIVPQIAFIFGIQIILTLFFMDGLWMALVLSHLIFVLPYVFLTLSATYRNFDIRYTNIGASLCGSILRSFLYVKLPMLMRPVMFAFAVGFSVSVAQYIPTVFIGAGRFSTITTEAVNMAGGSDRRVVAVYAIYQMALPMIMYMSAIFIPKLVYRNRKEMQA